MRVSCIRNPYESLCLFFVIALIRKSIKPLLLSRLLFMGHINIYIYYINIYTADRKHRRHSNCPQMLRCARFVEQFKVLGYYGQWAMRPTSLSSSFPTLNCEIECEKICMGQADSERTCRSSKVHVKIA